MAYNTQNYTLCYLIAKCSTSKFFSVTTMYMRCTCRHASNSKAGPHLTHPQLRILWLKGFFWNSELSWCTDRRLAHNTNSNFNTNSNEIHMLKAREHTDYTIKCTNSKKKSSAFKEIQGWKEDQEGEGEFKRKCCLTLDLHASPGIRASLT